MEPFFRNLLTQAGQTLPDDPAVRGLLLLTNGVLGLISLVATWRWFRAPTQRDRVRISVDQPAGQSVRITTGE